MYYLSMRPKLMNLEEKIKLHRDLSNKINEMEEQKKSLGLAIMQEMQSKTLRLGGCLVRCCSRLSIKLSIEEARSLNAVKLEETVDKDKIKTLYNQGLSINGVNEIHYIQISVEKQESKHSQAIFSSSIDFSSNDEPDPNYVPSAL